jgi:hypothetical protein
MPGEPEVDLPWTQGPTWKTSQKAVFLLAEGMLDKTWCEQTTWKSSMVSKTWSQNPLWKLQKKD